MTYSNQLSILFFELLNMSICFSNFKYDLRFRFTFIRC